MINSIKLSASPIKPTDTTEEIKQPQQSFGRIKQVEKDDSFESPSNVVKQKSKLELALIGVVGASTAAFAIFRGKLGKGLKLVGEKPALTTIGRLKQLSDFASKDGMTGLFNKTALLTDLEKEYKKAVKTKKNLSVAMLDMDNFKGINEIFSHDKGDDVLKQIAENVKNVATKHGAKGFRYGGEEFVITLADHHADSAHKIITELSDAIRKDPVIQGLRKEFLKKAKADLKFITPKISQLDTIFSKLRGETKIENHQEFADEIVSLIETHIKKYDPADTNYLDKLMATLKSAKPEELPNILKTRTIIEPDGTVGKELDKIQNQYSSIKNDLTKWTNHLAEHKAFTVSGGIVNLNDTSLIENGETLVKAADSALKSAKENGKNQLVTANNDIIKKTIEQIKKDESKKIKK